MGRLNINRMSFEIFEQILKAIKDQNFKEHGTPKDAETAPRVGIIRIEAEALQELADMVEAILILGHELQVSIPFLYKLATYKAPKARTILKHHVDFLKMAKEELNVDFNVIMQDSALFEMTMNHLDMTRSIMSSSRRSTNSSRMVPGTRDNNQRSRQASSPE